MYLSKAFASVSHQILMDKLNLIGFNDDALESIFSFLSRRSQQIVINNTVSDIIETYQGVRQGTVLGPLLLTSTLTIFKISEIAELPNTPMTVLYSANPKLDIACENLKICLENFENYCRLIS